MIISGLGSIGQGFADLVSPPTLQERRRRYLAQRAEWSSSPELDAYWEEIDRYHAQFDARPRRGDNR